MRRRVLVACLLALPAMLVCSTSVPASPVALGVWPTRVVVEGGGSQLVHVRNSGRRPVVLQAAPAGFSLDLRGRPKVLPRRSSTRWFAVGPGRLRIPPGTTRTLAVRALARRATPGDHPSLLLLRTVPPPGRGVGVRLRVGVIVDVQVPGGVRRRLSIRSLRILRGRGGRGGRELALVVANAGDVTERIERSLTLELWARHRLVARLRATPRDLLPHTRGFVEFPCRGVPHARLRVVVSDRGRSGVAPLRRRAFRVRL